MANGQLGNVLRYVRRLVGTLEAGEQTDRRLLERFAAQHDESAFAALVDRHGPMVLNVCRRVLADADAADDAFQATFLVLARKAAAGGWQESIGNWLYEVAYRTATKARCDAARRHQHEQQLPPRRARDPMADVNWRELREVLDEELSRLPRKYRAPVVLCYLEGKTNEEAAGLLGCPTGTVSGRLARARDLLRDRLSRRGLTVGAGGVGALIGENALEAAVPAPLAQSTVRGALLFAAGQSAGGVAAPVAALTLGVLKAMFMNKLKIALLLLIVVALTGTGLGTLLFQVLGPEAVAVPAPDRPAAKAPEGGPTVNGLKLTLSADKTETVMKADASDAEAVNLKLAFSNVSGKPIKLDAYDLVYARLTLDVIGPDGASVRKVDRRGAFRKLAPPKAEHFPIIKAGAAWNDGFPFPSLWTSWGFALAKPGQYRIKVAYANAQAAKHALAADSWVGTLTSNELVLTVLPVGGKEVNGLKLTLSADKTETAMKADGSNAEPVQLKLTFTNVSAKPIKFNAYDFVFNRIKCEVAASVAEGLPVRRVAVDRRAAPPLLAADFIQLKPGQSWSYDRDRAIPNGLAFPSVEAGLPQGLSTFAMYSVSGPGEFRLKFTYSSTDLKDALAQGAWTGSVTSNELVLTVKPPPKAEAQPVNGLKLTLSADKTETVMKADGSNAEPVKLKLTFTNVSDKPIKFNASASIRGWVQASVPQGLQVHPKSAVGRAPPQALLAGQFIEIQPGQSYSYDDLAFPGWLPQGRTSEVDGREGIHNALYSVISPGEFRLKFTYSPMLLKDPVAKGAWTGELTSNELVLTVKPAAGKQ